MLTLFKIFFRDSVRNKTYSILNILGLAVGMSAFILIILWVSDELSYDRYNDKADRIFRMKMFIRMNGDERTVAVSPPPLAGTLKNEFPEVENVVRLHDRGSFLVKYGNNAFKENRIIYADSTIFDIFTIPVIKHSPASVLVDPFSVAISESIRKKIFWKCRSL